MGLRRSSVNVYTYPNGPSDGNFYGDRGRQSEPARRNFARYRGFQWDRDSVGRHPRFRIADSGTLSKAQAVTLTNTGTGTLKLGTIVFFSSIF